MDNELIRSELAALIDKCLGPIKITLIAAYVAYFGPLEDDKSSG